MHKYLNFILSLIIATLVICGVALWKGLDGFLFAWVVNLMLMLCLQAFTGTVQPGLTADYYALRKWESGGRIYKYVGVNIYRKLLVWVGWERLNKKERPVNKSPEALKNLEYASRQSEFSHLIIFMIVMVLSLYVAVTFGIRKAAWLLILNILLNLYPIMVQRYNRPRFKRVLALKHENERTIH